MQVLSNHLFSAFSSYLRTSLKGNSAAASASSLLPPSIEEAHNSALDECVGQVSSLLMDDDIDLESKNLSEIDLVSAKFERHKAYVTFLKHSGIYRKLSLVRCVSELCPCSKLFRLY